MTTLYTSGQATPRSYITYTKRTVVAHETQLDMLIVYIVVQAGKLTNVLRETGEVISTPDARAAIGRPVWMVDRLQHIDSAGKARRRSQHKA